MPRALCLALLLSLAVMGNVLGQPSGEKEDPKAGKMSVQGSATVSVTPNVGKVYLSVSVNKDNVKEACDIASQTTREVTAAVKAASNDDTEVSTSNLSIQQNITYGIDGQQQVNGYICQNSLTIKVTNDNATQLAATIGSTVDAAIEAGGDYLTVSNMATELSTELRRRATNQAREKAVEDAIAIADILAEAAGVKLGPIKAISDTNMAPAPMPYETSAGGAMMAEGASAKQVPVSIGTADVTATVSMEYAFKNK